MPLEADIDRGGLLIAVVSGGISAFFHWAAVQTGEENPSPRKLRGQLIASFASGMLTAWALGAQNMVTIDVVGALSAAAVVGFTYGPAGLILAARFVAKKVGGDVAPDLETRFRPVGAPLVNSAVVSAPVLTAAPVAPAPALDAAPAVPDFDDVAPPVEAAP